MFGRNDSLVPRLTDATFDRAIASPTPILVTFSAPKRCPHCRAQKPALERLAAEGYPVYVLDVEQADSQGIEKRLGGRGVPFHKLYARGRLLLEKVGQLDAPALEDLFQRANQELHGGGYRSLGGMLAGFGRGELS